MTIITSNGSKWMGEELDSLEDLKSCLRENTLDPRFENYGNFIIPNPQSINGGPCYPDNPNVVSFFGNFYNCSHVFNIDTDDMDLIEELCFLIRANTESEKYHEARNELVRDREYWARRRPNLITESHTYRHQTTGMFGAR